MSYVTAVTIISNQDCEDNIRSVNNYLDELHHLCGNRFVPIDNAECAGDKFLDKNIYVGSINGLDHEKFIAHFRSLNWYNALLILSMPSADGYVVVPSKEYGFYTSLEEITKD